MFKGRNFPPQSKPATASPKPPQANGADRPQAVQPKAAARPHTPPPARPAGPPAPPPAYRPQPAPKVLQRKPVVGQPPAAAPRPPATKPAAPPVYRPQPAPKVLQPKQAAPRPANAGAAPRGPVAPPVYRPDAQRLVQPKVNGPASSSGKAAAAPSNRGPAAFRPAAPGAARGAAHAAGRVAQLKEARAGQGQPRAGAQAPPPQITQMTPPRREAMTPREEAQARTAHGAGANAIQRTLAGVIQRQINHDLPVYTTKNNRAGKVSVENIWGKPLGPGANAPSTNNVFGWAELMNAGHTLANPNANNSHYNAVRMHLWNGRLGGPGNDWRNLAPGPALINSSMSAGPETDSKDAVSKGFKIWLETEVWYQSNSGQPNDFTSVIPNRMKMEWGYMLDASNNPAKFPHPGVTRGPAAGPGWDVQIGQPAGALSQQRRALYTNLAQLQANQQPAALDQLLLNTSDQEKAQAYGLVSQALQKHMLLNYAVIYQGMQSVDRVAALGGLSAQEVGTLINLLGIGANHKALHDEVLEHLYADQNKLGAIFGAYGQQFKKSLLLYGKWDLIQALGPVADAIAKTDRAIFNLYPDQQSYALLDNMTANEIAALLNNRVDTKLFEDWAKSRGHTTADGMANFLDGKITDNMAQSFEDNHLRWLRSREQYQSTGRKSPRFTPY